ncbi:MAG: hypothetical protein A2Y33_14715 [Spirochaetes bacterium GWF1_51_8]|nr:MAG: hypothetical protein A2Y33_14715 [Spirochaetes bacterium GWF1_51_8]
MKRIAIALIFSALVGIVYAEDAVVELKLQEEQTLMTALKQNFGEEKASQVMAQVQTKEMPQNEYKSMLQFMWRYAQKNGAAGTPDDVVAAGEFYQKNNGLVLGTANEKHQALMNMAQKMIQTQKKLNNSGAGEQVKNMTALKTQAMMKNQLKEKQMSGEGMMNKFQYRLQYKWGYETGKKVPVGAPKH